MGQNVDYEIEMFWLGFKTSMINFYKQTIIKRPILEWSNYLNKLQDEKKYEDIEHCITKYISLYAMDLMRANNFYYINILNSNIKRWDKISNKYKIFDEKTNNKGCNLITTLLSIYTLLHDKDKLDRTIFDQLELFIFFNDFRQLILFAKENDMPSIIDRLLKYDSKIFDQIKEVLWINDNIHYPISGLKLFKHLDLKFKK